MIPRLRTNCVYKKLIDEAVPIPWHVGYLYIPGEISAHCDKVVTWLTARISKQAHIKPTTRLSLTSEFRKYDSRRSSEPRKKLRRII